MTLKPRLDWGRFDWAGLLVSPLWMESLAVPSCAVFWRISPAAKPNKDARNCVLNEVIPVIPSLGGRIVHLSRPTGTAAPSVDLVVFPRRPNVLKTSQKPSGIDCAHSLPFFFSIRKLPAASCRWPLYGRLCLGVPSTTSTRDKILARARGLGGEMNEAKVDIGKVCSWNQYK
ncbi:hypothetical protein PAPYR_4839 [Paratrimastix pyriformis]|uniref:Uncharacterized protein n=1 Tax=Paratrimastix pyriformis TaxID=342808 RepID=A0ABQ8UP59_9EUKA|nr:hypothetical protein PAPYR_4839 [Paratrimastix pyriformis]